MGDAGWVQGSIFLFLMLIKTMRRRVEFMIYDFIIWSWNKQWKISLVVISKSCWWWSHCYYRWLKLRKWVTKVWIHVFPVLVSRGVNDGGKVEGDCLRVCCWEVQLWKNGLPVKRRNSLKIIFWSPNFAEGGTSGHIKAGCSIDQTQWMDRYQTVKAWVFFRGLLPKTLESLKEFYEILDGLKTDL